jgi:hypothetical protein
LRFSDEKGRSTYLIERRNEALLRRYWTLTEEEHLRFDYVLKILSEQEFFLSEETIMNIIRTHGNKIRDLIATPTRHRRPRYTHNQLSLFTD